MKVVLLKDVKDLGRIGDIKDVSDGYARNFLLPEGMVKIATKNSLEKAEELKAKREEERLKNLEKVKELAKKIEGTLITIKVKADKSEKLYAAIKSEEIVSALKDKSFEIDADMVHFDVPIKSLGEFEVLVKLEHEVEARIKVMVEAE